jgi:hypothetical protein
MGAVRPLQALRRAWRAAGLAAALVAALVASAPCGAQSAGQGMEYQVKAAFIYKFAGYVDWPEGALGPPEAPFTIGVVGSDPLVEELTQVVGDRQLNERNVSVRKLKMGDSLANVRILFIGHGAGLSLPAGQLQQWTQQRPVLVVTESEGMLDKGGSMINFIVVERRVRFEISLDAVEKSGLRLSSRLLAVAQKVSSTGTP